MKLKELINPITSDFIFKLLHEKSSNLIFINENNYHDLDIEYVLSHSGNKDLSILFDNLYSYYNDVSSVLTHIANIILNNYEENWINTYKAYITDYNALENYSMIEKENVQSKVINKVSNSNDVYGFNSNDAVPSSKVESTSETMGSKDDNERELKRSGNIGVTTSQQMLDSEIKLRTYNFIQRVMNDIDKVMCLEVY